MATTRSTAQRAAALAAAFFLTAAPALANAEPDLPEANSCPYRASTPPAVDQSEVPKAGDPPAPLPVPATPLGGDLMAGCGIIAAPDMPPLP
ncbi:D-alanyl-D-alanine carboxypeptidase, partial [Mycobacterium sp. CBMA361]|nr:D-alanyl-D-alanine carboxypeptidase [Mycolicibacterium sp. CBMA 361]